MPIFYVFIKTICYINRSQSRFRYFPHFLSFEVRIEKNILDTLKYTKKAHLISNFTQKKFSSGGARTHEKEQKNDENIWRFGDSNSAKQHLALY